MLSKGKPEIYASENFMQRFKVIIEYDGSAFVGWQRQENGLGVQQVIEEAITKLSGETVYVQCAGRTDAGVHARGQVAHFDLETYWKSDRVRDGLNYHIRPHQVSILSAEEVEKEFNARFDAIERCYVYVISNRRSPLALEKGRAWWIPSRLDVKAMKIAGISLLGTHDFSTFRAQHCQARTPVKTLDEIKITSKGNNILLVFRARSFLYHQVRNIVGTLRLVGEGKWTMRDFESAFQAKERKRGGQTAPAVGLYLEKIKYAIR